MRWFYMMMLFAVLHSSGADPDPKKYKPESVEKDQKALTDNERQFLREVEQKFGVKSDISIDTKSETAVKSENKTTGDIEQKSGFPAVIAIEIVNDTETNSKGKRTIDANLGYGYRTNKGYSYSYFGKPAQDKGRFMIYPYSQEDIPARQNVPSQDYSAGKYSPQAHTSVEIQPSRAFELVSVKDEHGGYDYSPPATQLNYENVNTPETSAYTKTQHPSTLYTTYNGQGFTGLSGQFPTIMPNYFVDPSQLIKNPQYQSVGLTPEHLRPHGSNLGQRVVPVLVLRVPSSYLNNPTTELYANLPNNYPLSQHLNNVNLQALVNQYYQKNGYSFAPQVMAYQSPVSTAQPVSQEGHHYANPYVQPAYTHADYSGVQYSAVKPVMAKYPSSYTQQKYLVSPTKSLYGQPAQQQQYEYQYQYVSSTAPPQQSYYVQQEGYKTQEQVQQQGYKTQEQEDERHRYQNEQVTVENQAGLHDPVTSVEYRDAQQAVSQEGKVTSIEYDTPQNAAHEPQQSIPAYYESARAEASPYDHSQQDTSAYVSQQSAHPAETQSQHSSSSNYYYPKQTSQKQSVSVYPSQLVHSEDYQEYSNQNDAQQYVYQTQNNEASQGLVLTENYPTKDHTIATVLPYKYEQPTNQNAVGVQTVSYVTPMPTLKYQSQYKIMVPQTVLKNPNSEKVSYVTSHSLPSQYLQSQQYSHESNAEQEYTVGAQYVPPVASKASYPKNYHAHPKRQARPDTKSAASATSTVRKQALKTDKKKTM